MKKQASGIHLGSGSVFNLPNIIKIFPVLLLAGGLFTFRAPVHAATGLPEEQCMDTHRCNGVGKCGGECSSGVGNTCIYDSACEEVVCEYFECPGGGLAQPPSCECEEVEIACAADEYDNGFGFCVQCPMLPGDSGGCTYTALGTGITSCRITASIPACSASDETGQFEITGVCPYVL
ncbi:MAG: hypothetical protein LBJ73_05240 [Rickettsiales bacterium]|nr:hypothetical protein [Rickettsiales bacterium]